jgi:hypothetical protein
VRRLRRSWTVAAAAWLVAAASFAPAALAGPTGNEPTINFFSGVVARMVAVPAIVEVQTGYMTMASKSGQTSSFHYDWGFGAAPKGYVPAKETITYAQNHAKILWMTDLLTPRSPACAAGTPCVLDPPIQLFVTRTAAFAGLATGAGGAVACYIREPFRAMPYRAGVQSWETSGAYLPMVAHGNQVLITTSYVWSDGQPVTETDSVDATTRLIRASVFHVGAGPRTGEPAFGYAETDAALPHAPAAPAVTLCR